MASEFKTTLDGKQYTRRPNGRWVPTEAPWEKVDGPTEGRLESLFVEAKEKRQVAAQARDDRARAYKEFMKIARMSDDEWFERAYG